jgi:anti-sigma factor RsiW
MIPTQDFDRLSAYLDGVLSQKEKAALEARLAQDADMKAALDDLRRMKRAFRDLPRVKPPRNFALTPQQAQAVRPLSLFSWPVFPALRLATALAALAFVFVFAFDFMSLNPPIAQREAATSQEMLKAANSGEATATEIPPIFAPFALEAMTATVEAGNAGGAAESATPAAVATPGEVVRVAEAPTETIMLETPGAVGLPAQPDGAPLDSAAIAEAPQPPAAWPLRQWTIGLGVLTAVLACLTWLTRQK